MFGNLGDMALRQGRYDEAIDDYQGALAIAPEAAFLHNNLAIALGRQGRLDQAVESYQAALDLAPDFADAHSNLANIFARRGQFDEAIRHYQQALAITPNLAAAHNNLAYVLRRRAGSTRRSSSTSKPWRSIRIMKKRGGISPACSRHAVPAPAGRDRRNTREAVAAQGVPERTIAAAIHRPAPATTN